MVTRAKHMGLYCWALMEQEVNWHSPKLLKIMILRIFIRSCTPDATLQYFPISYYMHLKFAR